MPSVDGILMCDHYNKATEPYFPVVMFDMLQKVVLTFEFVHESLKCLPFKWKLLHKQALLLYYL